MGSGFASLVLGSAAAFGAMTAWLSGLRPDRFAGQLGLAATNAGGVSEIRAQYAGFFLAVATVCAAALLGVAPRPAALIVLIVVFGGLIGGRLASLAINGGVKGFSPTILSLYAIDSIGLAMASLALMVDGR